MMNDRSSVRFGTRLLFSGFLFFATHAVAKTNRRAPARATPEVIGIVVTFGDKISTFVITKTAEGQRIDFTATGEPNLSKSGTSSDWAFLNKRVDDLVEPSNDRTLCPRDNVVLKRGNQVVLSCLRAPNALAVQMRKLLRLLTTYI